MVGPLLHSGDWKVDVRFRDKGNLQATASGVLLVPPEDALAFVTDAAGDSLFRVVKRLPLPAAPDGSQRVEVVNKAAIRVLAWKIWTSNRVVYQISPRKAAKQSQESSKSEDAAEECNNSSGNPGARTVSFKLLSSNMLHSLSGTWKLEPHKIHHSALPHILRSSSSSSGAHLHAAAAVAAAGNSLSPHSLKVLASSNSSSSTSSLLPPGMAVDADGNITATLVRYEQHAQPKGLPPGVRFFPGMSDAVRMSIGREVRQMLDKVNHVALLEVYHGLSPQDALLETAQQLEQAGGSFKKLKKHLAAAAAAAAAAQASSTSSAIPARCFAAETAANNGWPSKGQQASGPVLDVQALEVAQATLC